MSDQALQRKKRLAAALRDNLKRRKAQQRVRSVEASASANPPAPDTNQTSDADRIPTMAREIQVEHAPHVEQAAKIEAVTG
jgi:hypothetical protein